MPKITDNYIHLENPDYAESEFRQKPGTQATINVVGSSTFGNGIVARYGLLKGNGQTAIMTYLFPIAKYDMATAKKWLNDHKTKTNKEEILNKDFTMVLPVTKSYEDENGTLFLKGEASNTDLDLQDDQMDISAIEDMKQQSIGKTGFLNHKYDIGKNDFGVIVGYDDSPTRFIPIFKVFDSFKQTIKERLDAGAKLGLSVGGKVTNAVKEGSPDSIKRIIKSVKLQEVSLTYFPANWGTLGTVTQVKKDKCVNGICKQIYDSIDLLEGGVEIVKQFEVNYKDKQVTDGNEQTKINKSTGDENVGDKQITIPEDVKLEKELVEQIDAVKEDNKAVKFIKNLLGIKEEKQDATKAQPTPEELQAACDEGDEKACALLEKETKKDKEPEDSSLKKEVESIKKKNDELEQKVYKLEKERNDNMQIIKESNHKKLVKDAIESYDVLKEDVKDEDGLTKKLEDEGFTKEEIEEDMDGCLKTMIKANRKAANKIKAHPIPDGTNPLFNKDVNEYQEQVNKYKKSLESQGKISK
jgi:hypothetical protein